LGKDSVGYTPHARKGKASGSVDYTENENPWAKVHEPSEGLAKQRSREPVSPVRRGDKLSKSVGAKKTRKKELGAKEALSPSTGLGRKTCKS